MRSKVFFKRVMLFLLVLVFLPLCTYSQDGYRDPFRSPFQKPIASAQETETEIKEQEQENFNPPPVAIEGILWSTSKPMTIISGEVYEPGAKIKDIDAKVFKIEKKSVSIYYRNKLYEMKIKEKISYGMSD
ncbi:MAG: hypothetical protein ABIH08_07080 [Candidatus Omnitrophota bacterium]